MSALKVVPFPCGVQHDVPASLRTLADDIESGGLQSVDRGVITLGYVDGGSFSVWGMGPRGVTDYSVLGLLALSQQMICDHIFERDG